MSSQLHHDDEEPTEMLAPEALAEMLAMARAARDVAKRALTPAPVQRPAVAVSGASSAGAAVAVSNPAPRISVGSLMVLATLAGGLIGIAVLSLSVL
ncbi:MAG: hypothetical protein ACI8PZ_000605 [Myxococcota bacterium]|jgi:hypothetical protein